MFAGSINGTGVLEVEVTSTARDNSLAEQARKGNNQRLADRTAKPLVPGVLVAAALIAVIGGLLGHPLVRIGRVLSGSVGIAFQQWLPTRAPKRRRRGGHPMSTNVVPPSAER